MSEHINLETFTISDFTFLLSKYPIPSSSETDSLSSLLKFPIPEMTFQQSFLKVSYKSKEILSFNAVNALKQVSPHTTIKVQFHETWKTKQDGIVNGEMYDWTYFTEYRGDVKDIISSNSRIDIEMLKKPDPILFYGEFVLFEDELADNGTSILSLRIRVMKTCFLILLRFFLRVDNVCFKVVETRYYHEFGKGFVVQEFKSVVREDYNFIKNRVGDPAALNNLDLVSGVCLEGVEPEISEFSL